MNFKKNSFQHMLILLVVLLASNLILTGFTKDITGYTGEGFRAFKAGKYITALKMYEKALAINPKSPQALNGKGVVLAFSGKPLLGLKYINAAIELKPDYLTAYFNAGLANELAKNYPAAIKAYTKIIVADPKNTWSYYGIACSYARMGDAKHAVSFLAKAIVLDKHVKMNAQTEKDFNKIRTDKNFINLIK